MGIDLNDKITIKLSTIANVSIVLIGIAIAVFINPAPEPEHIKPADVTEKVEVLKDLRLKSTPDPTRYSDIPTKVDDTSSKFLYCFLEPQNENPFDRERLKAYVIDEKVGLDGKTYVQYVYGLEDTNPWDSTLSWWNDFIKTDCNGESVKPDYKNSSLTF